MNNNKISNPKTEVPTGIEINDKDYITCLLTCLKDMVKNYTIAMTEASNESLYKSYYSMFQEIINLQRETFELMFRKGWYSLEQAEPQKINEKYQLLSKEYQELNLD
jgi:spore coat protein CotF